MLAWGIKSPSFSSATDFISLFNALSKLDPQASTFHVLNCLASSQVPNLPLKFAGLGQARECFISITNPVHPVLSRASLENKTLPYSPLSTPLALELLRIQSGLDSWLHRFNDFTSKSTYECKILRQHPSLPNKSPCSTYSGVNGLFSR